MKLEKKILSIAKNISANKAVRPSLAGVHIQDGNYYATDSYMCFASRSLPARELETSLYISTEELKCFTFKEDVDVSKEAMLIKDASGMSKQLGKQHTVPDFEHFMEKEDITCYATIDIENAISILKTLKDCGNKYTRVSMSDSNSKVHFDGAKDGDSTTYDRAVLMPLKCKN